MRPEHTLYIVATPIGHRGDLSARAIETLRGVSRIYAEDTRHSLPLLRHHGIDTPLRALHEHNESSEAERVVAHVREVGDAALISDAGTPLISDPGFRLVRACREAGLKVSPVPGPCAISAALSVGGLPTDRFQFVGFPPSRAAARRRWLEALAPVPHTLVLYESPHRVLDTLGDLVEIFGASRESVLARELTKRHETLLHGPLRDVWARVRDEANQRRGEFVLLIGGAEAQASDDPDAALALDRVIEVLLPRLPPKDIARCAAELCGVSRRAAYERVLARQARERDR